MDYSPAVSPGMPFAIFGSSFTPVTSIVRVTPLPKVLDGVTVEVNGQPAPLYFTSAGQINAQLPFGLSGSAQIRVRNSTGLSNTVTIAIVLSVPRLFTKTADGKGDPILIHNADFSLVSKTSPAVPGEYLILYLAGLGPVSPAIEAGQPGGDNATLGPVNQTAPGSVSLTLNGKSVPVLFAGLAPGFVGVYQLNFQLPEGVTAPVLAVTTKEGASTDTTLLSAPAAPVISASGSQTVGGKTFSSSSRLNVAWTAPGYSVDHYEVTAAESVQNTQLVVSTKTTQAAFAGLKAATGYSIVVKACADAGCRQSGTAAAVTTTTSNEYWQLQGTGNTTVGLTRIVSDGNVRISATRFGPEAGAVTANRVQLYYGPSGQTRQVLTTAITGSATSAATPSSYLSFTGSRATTGLLSPTTASTLIQTVNTGQGVPLSVAMGAKVRLFFEATGADQKTRIFSIDSVDSYSGQDFNSGSATTCSTAADFAAGGGCPATAAFGLEGDSVAPSARISNARQNKVGYPTLTDWRWDGAAGTFMVFTTDRISACSTSNRNHGYAVWDGSAWKVQYDSNGCPLLFTNVQAAFPMHAGGVKYKLYYGDTSITTGQLSGNLPFLGPKKLIYSDGTLTGLADRVDFTDWESQTAARDVVFLWPNGDQLNDTAEGYIDDYHFLAPTGTLDLQVMYMAITNGTENPFGAAAVLLNP